MRTVKYTIEYDNHRERWIIGLELDGARYYVWKDTLAEAFEWIQLQEDRV